MNVKCHLFAACTYVPLSLALVALSPATASAQLDLPRPSPGAKVTQTIGLTDVTVDYSSPGVKGRTGKIFGGLVPFNELWRTGANGPTKITFSKDVTFGDKPAPAGTYTLFTLPTATGWTVILNKTLVQNATHDYKQDQDLLRTAATTATIPARERMIFTFSNTTDNTSSLDLEWDTLRVSVPIKVTTDEQALANIKSATDNGWRLYANAARYLVETKKDYDGALPLIDKSLGIKEDWFNLWIKASIVAAKGKLKDAFTLATKADTLGMAAVDSYFAKDEVKKSIEEWKNKKNGK